MKKRKPKKMYHVIKWNGEKPKCELSFINRDD